ncbi:alpha/beta hydrolase-fold protein [uncultured Hymenobacter sp.]|uniref:alpha/beta hydrolase-fold protein n=1 Tax=uncultured Hymenobacter sp. TaxID=170016 RepID=UPI0035CAE81F
MEVPTPDLAAVAAPTLLRDESLSSQFLARPVVLDVLLPPDFDPAAPAPYPVLYLNDGQDLARLRLPATLAALYRMQALRPFVLVAIHASELRIQEYGLAGLPDYRGRGSRAGLYTDFIIKELLPYTQQRYHVSAAPGEAVVAGFSLGGLMAFDLAWQHPAHFGRAGVFSGSFWWRDHPVGPGYTEAARLAHRRVRAGQLHPRHQFWLQTGTLDETSDRNGNGLIDAVDDTLDLIQELQRKGLNVNTQMRYVQVEGGHHHQDTWGRVLPDFLLWAFGQPAPAARLLAAPLPVVRKQFHLLHSPPTAEPETATAPAAPDSLPPLPAPMPAAPTPVTSTKMRPAESEYAPFYAGYVNGVPADADPLALLRTQPAQLWELLQNLSDEQAGQGYAPGKWSLKEVVLHLADTERIFAYRALRFARGDAQSLLAFDQDSYAAASGANARSMSDVLAEYEAVRMATLALFGSFGPEQLARGGTANGHFVTVRALLHILPGHELHHLHVIRGRYLPALQGQPAQHASDMAR